MNQDEEENRIPLRDTPIPKRNRARRKKKQPTKKQFDAALTERKLRPRPTANPIQSEQEGDHEASSSDHDPPSEDSDGPQMESTPSSSDYSPSTSSLSSGDKFLLEKSQDEGVNVPSVGWRG